MEADIGMVFLFAGNFAPSGFMSCEGQLLSISSNTALFSILGTTYGGNGTNNFALPDLRGRVAVGQGQGPGLSPYVEGQTGGSESVTLAVSQIPAHSHLLKVNSGAATATAPGNTTYFAAGPSSGSGPNASTLKSFISNPVGGGVTLNPGSVISTGGGQPVSIVQPYLSMFYILTVNGIFPSRN